MRYLYYSMILFILVFYTNTKALEPNEILVIVNGDIKQSVEIGQYYCQRRNVPEENILTLSLGKTLADTISRDEYNKRIAGPVRERLAGNSGWSIKCMLTTYGVPYKVGPRGPLKDKQDRLETLKSLSEKYQKELSETQASSARDSASKQANLKMQLTLVKNEMDLILGKETDASVDSELSMVRFGNYELYKWQPNQFNKNAKNSPDLILMIMVCRLDGPTSEIASGLVDKAIKAEKTGLHGIVYVDSRGIADDKQPGSFGSFDQDLRDLAIMFRFRTNFEVKEERTQKLFAPGSCPQTAIYCGWYSLKNYVDAFNFVDGAIGIHIASWEAVNLRDSNSSEWCPQLLTHGITATFGAVAEPYLNAFPKPNEFFLELINGKCLVEAFYNTNPFCSWQLVLIGDPLYIPFAPGSLQH